MLPTAFHDVTNLLVISIETWHSILTAAEENGRVAAASSHDALWQSLTTDHPGKTLFDALEVLNELGNDSGRELLQNAADDREIQLGELTGIPEKNCGKVERWGRVKGWKWASIYLCSHRLGGKAGIPLAGIGPGPISLPGGIRKERSLGAVSPVLRGLQAGSHPDQVRT